MATYNGNDVYLSRDGVDVSAYYTDEISYTESNATQEITAGAGETHVERAPGLDDTQISLVLIYDAADVQDYIQKLKAGLVADTIYGPEGSGTGKPKFQGSLICSNVGHAVNIAKNKVMFSVTLQGNGAPTSRIHAGDTF